MSQEQTVIEVPLGTWTALTSQAVAIASWQVIRGDVYIFFQAVGEDDPNVAEREGGYLYRLGEGEKNLTIQELHADAPTSLVWAKPTGGQLARVIVDWVGA